MGNRRCGPDFKREAVCMVMEDGLGFRDVERSLGITHGVLNGWVQKCRDHQDVAFVGRVAPWSPEAELKRLRKENERLQRTRDILKKAAAIFPAAPHRYRVHSRAPLPIRRVQETCRVLRVSRSWQYVQLKSGAGRRQREDRVLLAAIKAAFDGGEQTYGALPHCP